jgi:hypothetical protein
MNTKEMRITEADVIGVKQNFINFLRKQEEFNGYVFEGSAINLLLDVLAYNTYYNAFYNNMTINEMFMDSATKRASVVSLAKHFGYKPRTVTSSEVVVEVLTNATQGLYYLPKYTKISTSQNGEKFDFLLMDDAYFNETVSISLTGSQTEYLRSTGPIVFKEGVVKKYSFINDPSNDLQKFIIPFSRVDSSTLVVKVQPDPSINEETVYKIAANITEITEDSEVYFLEENADGFLEIFFGDGILGRKLPANAVIRIEIFQSRGKEANGIGVVDSTSIFKIRFTDLRTLSGQQLTVNGNGISLPVRVLVPSSNGADPESKESIRFNSTRSFTTAQRAVTKSDYKQIILKDFPDINDVIVWGGEENSPPEYGKVFISAKPKRSIALSNREKMDIIETLTETRNVVGVRVEFVDPQVVFLNLTVDVKFDPIVARNPKNISTLVRKSIQDFFSENIRKFDADFYEAELSESIQNSDESIIANSISVVLEKRLVPNFGFSLNYEFDFNNPIVAESLSTNAFSYLDANFRDRDCFLDDDGNGNVRLFYFINNKKIFISTNIGIIDYETGKLSLKNFNPNSLIDNFPISMYVLPVEQDIYASRKMILEFDTMFDTSLRVNLEPIPYRNK